MEFNSELEVRQEIINRLDSVYEVFDLLIQHSFKGDRKVRDGIGYIAGIHKGDYFELKSNFESFYELRKFITKEFTTNYEDWHELIEMVYSTVNLFEYKKVLFMVLYETTSAHLGRLQDKIKNFVLDKEIDPVKNSVEYNTTSKKVKPLKNSTKNKPTLKKLSLKQRFEHVLNENDIELDEDKYILNFKNKKDFILYSFTSAKYDLALNGINENFANFLKENPKKRWLTDNLTEMLDGMYDLGEITLEEYQSFEADYDYSIFLVEDFEDLEITTKNNDSFVINASDLKTTQYSFNTIGDIVTERISNVDYYFIFLFGSPAYHSGVILLDDEISKEQILEKLTLIQVEDLTVGFRFNNVEDYFDMGDQIKEKYVNKTLIPVKKVVGKELDLDDLFEINEFLD
jgi:hypothetical protein